MHPYSLSEHQSFISPSVRCRPTNKAAAQKPNGKGMEVGIADDQARDFDFEKTEMKYDSTGMFHWTPARAIEDCILVGSVMAFYILCSFTHLWRIF